MSLEGDFIESCTIITTDSNELASQTNDRMPIIIHVAGYGTWFNPADCMAHALEIIIYALIDLLCQGRGELPIDPSGFLC